MKQITTMHLDFANLVRSDTQTILGHMQFAVSRLKKRPFPAYDSARVTRLEGLIKIDLFNSAAQQQVGVFCFEPPTDFSQFQIH